MVRSVALLLHGRLGGFRDPTYRGDVSHYNTSRQEALLLAKLSHFSIKRRVLEPNSLGVAWRVYIHSWNPEFGGMLDALWQPRASLHEPVDPSLPKVRSQHLSMKNALKLLAADRGSASADGLVLVARLDLFMKTELRLPTAPTTGQESVWLLHQCETISNTDDTTFTRRQLSQVRASCGCGIKDASAAEWKAGCLGGRLQFPFITGRTLGGFRQTRAVFGKTFGGFDANFNGFLNDWMFVATMRVAESFVAIYDRHSDYQSALRAIRGKHPTTRIEEWAHFYWALHVLQISSWAKVRWLSGGALRGSALEPVSSSNLSGSNLSSAHWQQELPRTRPLFAERDVDIARRCRTQVEKAWCVVLPPAKWRDSLVEAAALQRQKLAPEAFTRHHSNGSITKSPLAELCPSWLHSGRFVTCPVGAPACPELMRNETHADQALHVGMIVAESTNTSTATV